MNMKKIAILNIFIAFVLVLGSCSTSNDVVSNRLISKRKFNKGFHINKKSHFKSTNGEQEQEVLAFDTDSDAKSGDKPGKQKKITSNKAVVTKEQVKASVAEVSREVNSASDKKETKNNVASTDAKVNSELEATRNKQKERSSEPLKKTNHKKDHKSSSNSSGWSDSMFILAVILAILIPPVGVLVYTSIDWMKVLICLILTVLFFLPGMIYALLVVFDVI